MNEPYYKKGDNPGSWKTCPMGRICREDNRPARSDEAANILEKTTWWIEGYVLGFDSTPIEVPLKVLKNSSRHEFIQGYNIGCQDRKLWLIDQKEEVT